MLPILPPAVGAYLATTVELSCSALLALGLATRLAAAALLGMTLVIQLFVYPENWPDHLLWGSILAYLVTRGAGAISLDHVICRRWFGLQPAARSSWPYTRDYWIVERCFSSIAAAAIALPAKPRSSAAPGRRVRLPR